METIEKTFTQPLKISYGAERENLKNLKKEMIWIRVRSKLLRAWVYTTNLAIDGKKGNIVNETNEIEFGFQDKSKKIKWLKCSTDKIKDGFNSESEEKKLIHKIRKKIKRNSGINVNSDEMIKSKLHNITAKLKIKDTKTLIEKITSGSHPEIEKIAYDYFTTNDTLFYRDRKVFDEFLQKELKKFLEDNEEKKEIKIWSAACSDGREPYTLAMLLQEFFYNKGNWKIKIYATDYSEEMIQKAQAGVYSADEINNLPKYFRDKYLKKLKGNNFAIEKKIKNFVHFETYNLKSHVGEKLFSFDYIFLRNVLGYFDGKGRNNLLLELSKSLSNSRGGIILGASEDPQNIEYRCRSYCHLNIYHFH